MTPQPPATVDRYAYQLILTDIDRGMGDIVYLAYPEPAAPTTPVSRIIADGNCAMEPELDVYGNQCRMGLARYAALTGPRRSGVVVVEGDVVPLDEIGDLWPITVTALFKAVARVRTNQFKPLPERLLAEVGRLPQPEPPCVSWGI